MIRIPGLSRHSINAKADGVGGGEPRGSPLSRLGRQTNQMNEPEQLIRGKFFQKIVQQDFSENSKDGNVTPEAFICFEGLRKNQKKSGRADILITELGEFVTILEIKATDWDKIKSQNIKKNLWRHQHQLLRYVEKYIEVDNMNVCLGIIYPHPPQKKELRDVIESYLDHYGTPAYWYSEIKTENI